MTKYMFVYNRHKVVIDSINKYSFAQVEKHLRYLQKELTFITNGGGFTRTLKRKLDAIIKNIKKNLKLIKTPSDQFLKGLNDIKVQNGALNDAIKNLIFSWKYYGYNDQLKALNDISKKHSRELGSKVVQRMLTQQTKLNKGLKSKKLKISSFPTEKYFEGELLGGKRFQDCGTTGSIPIVAPANGLITFQDECNSTIKVNCDCGFLLSGVAEFERANYTENIAFCQPKAIGYWPLNKKDEGINFAGVISENCVRGREKGPIKVADAVLGNDAKFVNGVSGKENEAVQLDRSYISISNNGYLTPTRDFTWMFYVKLDKTSEPFIPLLQYSKVRMGEMWIGVNKNDGIEAGLIGNNVITVESDAALESNTWSYIAVSYKQNDIEQSATLQLYVFNASNLRSFNQRKVTLHPIGRIGTKVTDSTSNVFIGKDASTPRCFACLKFCAAALSEGQIARAEAGCRQDILIGKWPLNDENILDASNNSNHLMATGPYTPLVDGPKQSRAISVRAPELKFHLEDVKIPNTFTWLGAFYIEEMIEQTCALIDFSEKNDHKYYHRFHIWIDKDSNNGQIKIMAGLQKPTLKNTVKSERIFLKQWYHVAFTYIGTTGYATLYLKEEDSNDTGLKSYSAMIGKDQIEMTATGTIGGSVIREMPMRGRITCIALYSDSLTEAEINRLTRRCLGDWPNWSDWGHFSDCHASECRPLIRSRMCMDKDGSVLDDSRCPGEGIDFDREPASCELCTGEKIAGGSKVRTGNFSWIVSLSGSEGHFCGAAILSASWILSAAHCICPESPKDVCCVDSTSEGCKNLTSTWKVTAGKLKLSAKRGGQTRTIKAVYVHKNYSTLGHKQDHDVALINLNADLDFKDSLVQPAVITGKCETYNTDEDMCSETHAKSVLRQYCRIAGWGYTGRAQKLADVLQSLSLPNGVDTDDENRPYYLRSKAPSRSTACKGDSGGPLLCDPDSKHLSNTTRLMGIMSYIDPVSCGHDQDISTYHNYVPYFLPWIVGKVKEYDSWNYGSCVCNNDKTKGTQQNHRSCHIPLNIDDPKDTYRVCGKKETVDCSDKCNGGPIVTNTCTQKEFNNNSLEVIKRLDNLRVGLDDVAANITRMARIQSDTSAIIGDIVFSINGYDLGSKCSSNDECCVDNSRCLGNSCTCMVGFIEVASECKAKTG
ncbi:unnamed protein product [Owenia fusiformis]|uniref:Peptidase S1 domain-containing protein n=1 Tax=Owenia fusiformis TaxID=6347 RepID=A0A8S4Q4V7_OWEFU|nr:unnamed protein product [Owenia fusiformis]